MLQLIVHYYLVLDYMQQNINLYLKKLEKYLVQAYNMDGTSHFATALSFDS